MKKLYISVLTAVFLNACASVEELTGNTPIIDTKGVNLAYYDTDLAECQTYADQVQMAEKAAAGAVSGAVVGGLIGAVWGNSDTAARSAGTGAIGGGAGGIAKGVHERDRVIKRCLSGRGYRVLN